MKRLFLLIVLSSFSVLSACSTQATPTTKQTPELAIIPSRTPAPTKAMTPTPLLFRRLENGTFIKGQNGSCKGGCNTLTVVAGSQDTVVTFQGGFIYSLPVVNPLPTNVPPVVATVAASNAILIEKMAAFEAVYIRAKQKFTFYALQGTYRICFTQGEDWDSRLNRFTRHAAYDCIKENYFFSIPFPRYKNVTITLNPVKGGTLVVVPQTQDSFPAIKTD